MPAAKIGHLCAPASHLHGILCEPSVASTCHGILEAGRLRHLVAAFHLESHHHLHTYRLDRKPVPIQQYTFPPRAFKTVERVDR